MLKGNYMLKTNWRKEQGSGNTQGKPIPGLTIKNFNQRDESVQMIEAAPPMDNLTIHQNSNIDMANIYSQGINFGTLDETNKFNTIQS